MMSWASWPENPGLYSVPVVLLALCGRSGPVMPAWGRGEEDPASGRVLGEEVVPCSWAQSKRRGEVEGRKGHVIQSLEVTVGTG